MPGTAQRADIGDALNDIYKKIRDLQAQVTAPTVMGASGGVAEGDDVSFNSVTIGGAGSTYVLDLAVQAVDPLSIVVTPGSYIDNSYIDVSWTNPGASVVEYEVEISKQISPGVFALPDIVRTGGTSVRFNNLEVGQTYGFRITSINRLGIRSAPIPASYATAVAVADSGLPPAPTGVTLARGATSVIVKFTPLTAAQAPDVANGRGQYHVQISTSPTIATVAQEVYTNDQIVAFSDITAEATYYARVRAIDDSGNAGAWSSISTGALAGGVIDNMIVAGLDAAKITVGFLNASRIQANTLTADKLATGSLTSADITIAGGSLRAGSPPTTGILINSQGLSLYGASLRTVFMDAATGNATFEGTVGGRGMRATPNAAENPNASADAVSVLGYVNLVKADNSNVTAPATAGTNLTGDLEVIAYINMRDWTPAGLDNDIAWILGKYSAGVGQYGMGLQGSTGKLGMYWVDNAGGLQSALSTVATGFTDYTGHWVKANIDIDNGAAGRTIKFYWSNDPPTTAWNAVNWTQLGGNVVQAGVTTIKASVATLTIGSIGAVEEWDGRFYKGAIVNGIGGAAVASPDFGPVVSNAGVTDAQGNTWTINAPANFGQELTGWTADIPAYFGSYLVRATGTKYAGASSVRIGNGAAYTLAAVYSDKINVVPGDFYEVRGYMYCPANYSLIVGVEFFAGATSLGVIDIADASWDGVYDAWRPISYNDWGATPIVAPSNATQVRVHVRGYGSVANYQIWIDEVSIAKVPLIFGGVASAPQGVFQRIFTRDDGTHSRIEIRDMQQNSNVATGGPRISFWTEAAGNDPTYGYEGRIEAWSGGTGPNYYGAIQIIPSHNSTSVAADGQGILTIYRGNIAAFPTNFSFTLNGSTHINRALQVDLQVRSLKGELYSAYTDAAFHSTNRRTFSSDTIGYPLGCNVGGLGALLRCYYSSSGAWYRWEGTLGNDTNYTRMGALAFDVVSSIDWKTKVRALDRKHESHIAGLKKLRPVSFRYKSEKGFTKQELAKQSDGHGLIAEEVEEIYPDAVVGGAIDYAQITTHVIAALQELEERVAQLEAA